MDTASGCKKLLIENGIDSMSSIDFDVNGTPHSLSFEYIIDTYMQASDASQLVFLQPYKKRWQQMLWVLRSFLRGWGNCC